MFTFGRMTGDGLGRAVGMVSGTGGGEGGTEDQSDQGKSSWGAGAGPAEP